MRKRFLTVVIAAAIVLAGYYFLGSKKPATNPDPNHTHADFAIWVHGEKLDFSGEEYMSGSSTEESDGHDHEHLHPYLHLHDGNGHVIHRHKPDLTLGDFLASNVRIRILTTGTGSPCLAFMAADGCRSETIRMFVNGMEVAPDPDYVFSDLDRILITDSVDEQQVTKQLADLTQDACVYSQTCPERGAPPTEGCVSDPEVPCTE